MVAMGNPPLPPNCCISRQIAAFGGKGGFPTAKTQAESGQNTGKIHVKQTNVELFVTYTADPNNKKHLLLVPYLDCNKPLLRVGYVLLH